MVGNNSCGSHSLIYGSTRDNLLEVDAILSDGSKVRFGELTNDEFVEKTKLDNLEGKIYRNIQELLSNEKNQEEIRKEYPTAKINRRNTGYAIDVMLEHAPFTEGNEKFNFCKLIAGSEGTLAFITEIKLKCVDLPKTENAVVCVHVGKMDDCFKANLIALKQKPSAVEMIDKYILDCTKTNISQSKNRFFLEGDPEALLVVELNCDTKDEIVAKKEIMEKEMRKAGYAYAFPILYGDDINKVWALRKAGLGLLSNVPGDKKPVAVIEDTAVDVEVLPEFMAEFKERLDFHKLNCVYYAHIGSGELHLRPILNLKDEADVKLFRIILKEIAELVKKYKGSLCGEHGTGRLRGEFIPFMIGKHNYKLIESVKKAWDPNNLFNPNKIVNTPKMTDKLRYAGHKEDDFETYFDFSSTLGFIKGIEKCNGSGDCRKSSEIGGTMCPSFQASGDEFLSTRARANLLRECFYSGTAFDDKELYQILNFCLSCKACKSECPSNVDMTKLKAEFLQQYYIRNGIPLRTKMIANITTLNKIFSKVPWLFNMGMSNKLLSSLIMSPIGFASKRSMPMLYKYTLRTYIKRELEKLNPKNPKKEILFFVDEFTDYNDTKIGIIALKLLTSLGYQVNVINHKESGRTYLSKGLLKKAKALANFNVEAFSNSDSLIIGVEPSTILSF
jgi:FAD/FMN-containing dehydrogenase/ferredoxin